MQYLEAKADVLCRLQKHFMCLDLAVAVAVDEHLGTKLELLANRPQQLHGDGDGGEAPQSEEDGGAQSMHGRGSREVLEAVEGRAKVGVEVPDGMTWGVVGGQEDVGASRQVVGRWAGGCRWAGGGIGEGGAETRDRWSGQRVSEEREGEASPWVSCVWRSESQAKGADARLGANATHGAVGAGVVRGGAHQHIP